MPGGSATPGPPARTQALISSSVARSSTPSSHTGRAPAARPAGDGETTATVDCAHASRQSLSRTRPVPSVSRRSRST